MFMYKFGVNRVVNLWFNISRINIIFADAKFLKGSL